jgi:hypothetical protein
VGMGIAITFLWLAFDRGRHPLKGSL